MSQKQVHPQQDHQLSKVPFHSQQIKSATPANTSTQHLLYQQQSVSTPENVLRLCGYSWNDCGYCKGQRASLAQKESRLPSNQRYAMQDDGSGSSVKESSSCNDNNTNDVDIASTRVYSTVATTVTTKTYEALIYRGWRRSGRALYKPQNFVSCCPQLTIRLPVAKFQATTSQKRVLRKMDAVVNGNTSQQKTNKKEKNSSANQVETYMNKSGILSLLQKEAFVALTRVLHENLTIEPVFKLHPVPNNSSTKAKTPPKEVDSSEHSTVLLKTTVCAALAGRSRGKLDRADLSRQLRDTLSQKTQMLSSEFQNNAVKVLNITAHEESGQVFAQVKLPDAAFNTEKSNENIAINTSVKTTNSCNYTCEDTMMDTEIPNLESWLKQNCQSQASWPGSSSYKLTTTTLRAHESALDPAVHQLYFRYQHVVHDDPDPYTCKLKSEKTNQYNNATDGNVNRQNHNGELNDDDDICMDNGDHSMDGEYSDWGTHAPVSWRAQADNMLQQVYGHLSKARQERIAQAYGEFYDFLVDNPFPTANERTIDTNKDSSAATRTSNGTTLNGLYHQHYKVAGQLIAVGVVDVLPQGLSSVYLYYDSSFARQLVPLGKYVTLREIEFTRSQLQLPYYYLGYYIESCDKMKYKAEYMPSEILCPVTYQWVDAVKAKEIIARDSPIRHCCRLYYDKEKDDKKAKRSIDMFKNGDVTVGQQHGAADIAKDIQMEVGLGIRVKLPSLPPAGQNIVLPFLEQLVHEAGDIARQICVDFQ